MGEAIAKASKVPSHGSTYGGRNGFEMLQRDLVARAIQDFLLTF